MCWGCRISGCRKNSPALLQGAGGGNTGKRARSAGSGAGSAGAPGPVVTVAWQNWPVALPCGKLLPRWAFKSEKQDCIVSIWFFWRRSVLRGVPRSWLLLVPEPLLLFAACWSCKSTFLLTSGSASSGQHSCRLCFREISSGGVSNENQKQKNRNNNRNKVNEAFQTTCLLSVPLLS